MQPHAKDLGPFDWRTASTRKICLAILCAKETDRKTFPSAGVMLGITGAAYALCCFAACSLTTPTSLSELVSF